MAEIQTNTSKKSVEKWSKATLSNRFMFRLVMEDKDICKETLELLKYSFKNVCLENESADLNDQSLKIIINTRGNTNGYSQKVINFMEYINNETITDDFTKKLNEKVERLRQDDEKERAYMTFEQEMREAEAKMAADIAENMIRDGIPLQSVQKYTKITLEQLQKIADRIGMELK